MVEVNNEHAVMGEFTHGEMLLILRQGRGLLSVQPPSTTKVCPVIQAALSEARKVSASAISRG